MSKAVNRRSLPARDRVTAKEFAAVTSYKLVPFCGYGQQSVAALIAVCLWSCRFKVLVFLSHRCFVNYCTKPFV